MPLLILTVAVINLALGYGLAVYLGHANRIHYRPQWLGRLKLRRAAPPADAHAPAAGAH